MEKQNWLILGGVGYIGRNLVKLLVDEEVAASIVIVDKSIPEMSHFHPMHLEAFSHPSVRRLQVDLSRDPSAAFQPPPNIIVNLAGETRPALPDIKYQQNTLRVVERCLPLVTPEMRWIEVSTAQVYAPNTRPATETASLAPSSRIAYWRLECERAIAGLNHVILRPGIVYGLGDFTGISKLYSAPRLIIGTVYQQLREKMRVPWVKDLPQHTVHVEDLCRAIVLATQAVPGSVLNVADSGDTRLKTLTTLMEQIFGIRVDYLSGILRKLADTAAATVCEEANEKHMGPWTDMCSSQGVNTPLSPFLELEDMRGIPIALDSSRLVSLGWRPHHPAVTRAALVQQVDMLVAAGAWPQVQIHT